MAVIFPKHAVSVRMYIVHKLVGFGPTYKALKTETLMLKLYWIY